MVVATSLLDRESVSDAGSEMQEVLAHVYSHSVRYAALVAWFYASLTSAGV